MIERDFKRYPYTADERKVVEYLTKICPDIGAGDDPITFLIASHAQQNRELRIVGRALKSINEVLSRFI